MTHTKECKPPVLPSSRPQPTPDGWTGSSLADPPLDLRDGALPFPPINPRGNAGVRLDDAYWTERRARSRKRTVRRKKMIIM